jgi:hypothetical protein
LKDPLVSRGISNVNFRRKLMPVLDEEQQRFKDAAKRVYEEKLRAKLEPEHIGQVSAVEPESEDYVLGASLKEVDAACRARFGSKPVYIFCVGGGGAKLFGSRGSARLLART